MSRRSFLTLVTLVAWLAAVNHCALNVLAAAGRGGASAVCAHCSGGGTDRSPQPRLRPCCQELSAHLPEIARLVAPVWTDLLAWQALAAEPERSGARTVPVPPSREESPPRFLLAEVLRTSLAAHAPPARA